MPIKWFAVFELFSHKKSYENKNIRTLPNDKKCRNSCFWLPFNV